MAKISEPRNTQTDLQMSESGNICETEHSTKRTISESNNFVDSYFRFFILTRGKLWLYVKSKMHSITPTHKLIVIIITN